MARLINSTRFALCLGMGMLLAISCDAPKEPIAHEATTYDFPKPVDTEDHEVTPQEVKVYGDSIDGVFADNNFAGARLNNFMKVNDTLYQVTISPENEPVNHSSYYSFRVWSHEAKDITIELNYTFSKHRYQPKTSVNGREWRNFPVENLTYIGDSTNALLKISVSADTLWVSAQELMDSKMVGQWSKGIAKDDRARMQVIGKSREGRDLILLDLYEGEKGGKETIVLLSRQHPPEVTGFMAMQAFAQELLDNDNSSEFFKKYRVMIFPLLNPDGVDLGHWRHNTGGIDLNRDWAYYNQPETRQVANYLVSETNSNDNEVILGLDFHSTWHDVYYTLARDEITTSIPRFTQQWFRGIEKSLGNGYQINEKPSGLGSPVTKGWFYTQFGAEGITYEIGDETPRDFIQVKGQVSAQEMINVFLKGDYR
jgi:hypothetical protein